MSQPFGQPPSGQPGEAFAVPYVDAHQGPKRRLTVRLDVADGDWLRVLERRMDVHAMTPIVSIDGRQYLVYWGIVSFDIPADRPCHVSVHVDAEYVRRAASLLLPPGTTPVDLRYFTDLEQHRTVLG